MNTEHLVLLFALLFVTGCDLFSSGSKGKITPVPDVEWESIPSPDYHTLGDLGTLVVHSDTLRLSTIYDRPYFSPVDSVHWTRSRQGHWRNRHGNFEEYHVHADGFLYAIAKDGLFQLKRNRWFPFPTLQNNPLVERNDPFGGSGYPGSDYRAVASSEKEHFYVGAWRDGIARYDREADEWTALSVDFGEVPDGEHVNVMELEVGPDGTVYALSSRGGGVLRSESQGRKWEPMGNLQPVGVEGALLADENLVLAGKIFKGGGLFRWVDGAWKRAISDCTGPAELKAHPAGYIVAACAEGVFLSSDRGRSFALVSEGLTNRPAVTVAVDEDGTLYFGDRGGKLFRGRIQPSD